MNVQFIEKLGEGKKDFETVEDGDVVILPAFGASFEEMDYFDKKVGDAEFLACSCDSHTFRRMLKLWIQPVLGCRRFGTLSTSTKKLG